MFGLALAHLALAPLAFAGDVDGGPAKVEVGRPDVDAAQPTEAGFHRGTGWRSTGPVPEPPVALALVIVGAAGMRAYERRLRRRAG